MLQSTYEGRLECICQPRKKTPCVDNKILGSSALEEPLKKISIFFCQVINSVEPITILGCLKERKYNLRLHSQTRKYFSGLKVLFLASRTHFGVWFCDLFELQIKLCIYELN